MPTGLWTQCRSRTFGNLGVRDSLPVPADLDPNGSWEYLLALVLLTNFRPCYHHYKAKP